jgi:hypothetical protein
MDVVHALDADDVIHTLTYTEHIHGGEWPHVQKAVCSCGEQYTGRSSGECRFARRGVWLMFRVKCLKERKAK